MYIHEIKTYCTSFFTGTLFCYSVEHVCYLYSMPESQTAATSRLFLSKARFKRRTFHVPNLIPIWVDPRIINFGSMIHTSNFSCTELNIRQEETSEFSSCTLKNKISTLQWVSRYL